MSFQILTVCTGNICRSPAAELLLASELDDSVRVTSAGTQGLVGQPVHGPMDRLLQQHGLETKSFQAKRISPMLIKESKLILTATNQHRVRILEEFPLALRKTFTLKEFSRIIKDTGLSFENPKLSDGEKLGLAITKALQNRKPNPAGKTADDIADPYKKDDEFYLYAFQEILDSIKSIRESLGSK